MISLTISIMEMLKFIRRQISRMIYIGILEFKFILNNINQSGKRMYKIFIKTMHATIQITSY